MDMGIMTMSENMSVMQCAAACTHSSTREGVDSPRPDGMADTTDTETTTLLGDEMLMALS
jgi:hypothetical protein